MSDFPTRLWLTNSAYQEGKKSVILEFSRLGFRRMSRVPFFPSFFADSKEIPKAGLERVIRYDRRKFRLSCSGNSTRVKASTFFDLERIADQLFRETGFRPLVIEPERQFLLENGWSYFDCFSFFPDGNFAVDSMQSFPEVQLPFFSEPLHETISQLADELLESAEQLSESIALSSLLKLGLSKIPEGSFARMETLLENAMWKTGLGQKRPLVPESIPPEDFGKVIPADGMSEVDFGLLWPTLLTKPLYNLGPDSMQCDCCMPRGAESKNLLPNSMVLVEMLQDAFFFESRLPSFAAGFHGKSPDKESRLRRKKEFCLSRLPVGPFFRGQRAEVPLIDAISLQEEGKAKVLGLCGMRWFCLGKESAVSGLVLNLNSRIALSERKAEELHSASIKKHGILGPALVSKDPGFLLSRANSEAISELLYALPKHLCNRKSAFFSQALCSAVEAVEASLLGSFESFASERKSRVSLLGERALLRAERPNSLVREFSERQRIPQLLRARSR